MMSIVSPYIDNFNVAPAAKRVNVNPVLDLAAGYDNLSGFTPTDVYLGDAPKAVGKPKFPTHFPVADTMPSAAATVPGSVPLYTSQHKIGPAPNANHWYAPEFKNTKLHSGFENHLQNYFEKLSVEQFNRHANPQTEVGEVSLEETTEQKLRRLIQSF